MIKYLISFFLLSFIIFSPNSGFSGFWDDTLKAVGDGINKGINDAINPNSRRNNGTINNSIQSRNKISDEKRGTELYNEAINLNKDGRNKEAIEKLKEAIIIARAYNNTFGEMNCGLLIGIYYVELEEHRYAINYLKDALDTARKVSDKERILSAINILIICHGDKGIKDYVSAINYLQQKKIIITQLDNKVEIIKINDDICENNIKDGDTLTARAYREENLMLSRELKNDKLIMEQLFKMGFYYQIHLGSLSKSKEYYEQAINIGMDLDDGRTKLYISQLGNVYAQLGDYRKALDLKNKAKEFKIVGVTKDIDRVTELFDIAIIYQEMDDYNNAINIFEQSLAEAIKPGKSKNEIDMIKRLNTVEMLNDQLSILYLMIQNNSKAKEAFKHSSKDGMQKAKYYVLSDQPSKAIVDADMFNFPKEWQVGLNKDRIAAGHTIFGLAYEKLKDFESAKKSYTKAIEYIEMQRDELLEEDKLNYMAGKTIFPFNRLSPYEGLIRVSPDEEAFMFSENIKARVLLEQISGRNSNDNNNISGKHINEDNKINDEIANVVKIQNTELSKPNNNDKVFAYEKELIILKDKKGEFIKYLYKQYPEYASIKYPKPLRLSEIRLASEEVLIEYAITDTQLKAWMIRNNRIEKTITNNITRYELEKMINEYLIYLSNMPNGKNIINKINFDVILGNRLYDILIKDFIPYINSSENIIIIPDKKLALLPFEALVISSIKNNPIKENIQFIGDKYNISYYQSASALTMNRILGKKVVQEKDMFILSDPVFNISDSRVGKNAKVNTKKNDNKLMRAIEDKAGLNPERLELTSKLSAELAKIFKTDSTDQLTGIDASENKLKKTDLLKYKYIVFATHGIIDSKVSGIMEPALILTQIDNRDGENGFLTLSKVMNLKMNSDVTALTACQTWSGKFVGGEGVMGLGRAFQYAGSKSVLASLWSVADKSTILLVERFFNYQKVGQNRLNSLKMARNDVKTAGFEHPFYWAPFILIGEGKNK